jgi:NTE family protein
MDELKKSTLGLVLSGGGARGAYEAGVIHYMRTVMLEQDGLDRRFDVICGSSVGAINACFMGASSHNLKYQGEQIYKLWENIRQESVYKRSMASLTKLISSSTAGIFHNFFSSRLSETRRQDKIAHFKGVLDTSPFVEFLNKNLPWKQISLNIQNQLIKAVSVIVTNIHTGKVELYMDKHEDIIYTGRQAFHVSSLEPKHALASAAIPILFPSIRIKGNYYCDGGLRMNTPLAPAIQLGADKILVIGLHQPQETSGLDDQRGQVLYDVPPTLGELLGQVLKSVMVDRLDYDVAQMMRLNHLIDAGEKAFGKEFLDKMNTALMEEKTGIDLSVRGLRKIEMLHIHPSQDVRELFYECVETDKILQKHLSTFEKFVLKFLDVDLKSGLDFLTFILFVPEYLHKLLELGFEDAKANHQKILEFMR